LVLLKTWRVCVNNELRASLGLVLSSQTFTGRALNKDLGQASKLLVSFSRLLDKSWQQGKVTAI
tara:strand:+ start:333 stop:524 length:192 start_codon:yes stop_codon:yes gene_type:complete